MRLYRILSLLFIFASVTAFGQAPAFEWAITDDGREGYGIAKDDLGNVYVTGGSTSNSAAFVYKINPDGQTVWSVSFDPSEKVIGRGIAVDSLGNAYITGEFTGTIDFDPGPSTFNLTSAPAAFSPSDVFVLKIDTEGSFVWAKRMGGTSSDIGYAIVADEAGNVFTIGTFIFGSDFDPGPDEFTLVSEGDRDIFISKLDSDGDFVWAKSIGDNVTDLGLSITLDKDNNVLTAGWFSSYVDFDPGPDEFILSNMGVRDLFVLKLNNDGDFIWAKTIGGGSTDDYTCGHDIVADGNGDIYMTGIFSGSQTDFDPGSGVHILDYEGGIYDSFVLKLDRDGNFLWAKPFGGNISDNGRSIAVDKYNNVYTMGIYGGTVDFDPDTAVFNLTSVATAEIFILKLDTDGSFVWVGAFSGTVGNFASSYGAAILVDDCDNIYSTGNYQAVVDFDPGSGVYELEMGNNVFIHKMSQSCNPVPVFSSSNHDISEGFCLGESTIELSVEMFSCIDNVSYLWDSGQASDTIQVTPDSTSTYTVYANYMMDTMSCSSSSSIEISVFEPIPISLTNDMDTCAQEEVMLEAQGGELYSWSTGDSTNQINVIAEETQTYFLTVTDMNGCTGLDSVLVSVNALPVPEISGNLEICPGDTITLTAEGGESYFWSTNSTTDQINVIPLLDSEYIVTVTDINGCTESTSITLLPDERFCPPCALAVPNAFTPDGDGVNDSFFLLSLSEVKVMDFRVYNRWGKLVHDNIKPWNGTKNGKPQPFDVYIYHMQVETRCGLEELIGDVTLIR